MESSEKENRRSQDSAYKDMYERLFIRFTIILIVVVILFLAILIRQNSIYTQRFVELKAICDKLYYDSPLGATDNMINKDVNGWINISALDGLR